MRGLRGAFFVAGGALRWGQRARYNSRGKKGARMRFSRWWYYFTSIPTLLIGITNWPAVIGWLIKPAPRGFGVVALRGGLRFEARSLMDIWVIKETCLDRGYENASVPLQPDWTVIDIGAGL